MIISSWIYELVLNQRSRGRPLQSLLFVNQNEQPDARFYFGQGLLEGALLLGGIAIGDWFADVLLEDAFCHRKLSGPEAWLLGQDSSS